MKKIVLLFLSISILLFGKTVYKSQAFIVSGQELFCTDHYGETIVSKKIGDLIESEYAYTYCSYNKETVIERQKYQSSVNSREKDKEKEFISYFLIAIIVIILLSSLIMTIYLVLKDEN